MFVTMDLGNGRQVVHLQTVKPPRIVPGPERHKWSRVPARGQVATCLKCGCQKCYRLNYDTVYRQKDRAAILTDRPACTGPVPLPSPPPTPHE